MPPNPTVAEAHALLTEIIDDWRDAVNDGNYAYALVCLTDLHERIDPAIQACEAAMMLTQGPEDFTAALNLHEAKEIIRSQRKGN